jgi:hypothetical protein
VKPGTTASAKVDGPATPPKSGGDDDFGGRR